MNRQAEKLAAWTVREVLAQLSGEAGWCTVYTDAEGVRLKVEGSPRLDPARLPGVVDVRFNHYKGEA